MLQLYGHHLVLSFYYEDFHWENCEKKVSWVSRVVEYLFVYLLLFWQCSYMPCLWMDGLFYEVEICTCTCPSLEFLSFYLRIATSTPRAIPAIKQHTYVVKGSHVSPFETEDEVMCSSCQRSTGQLVKDWFLFRIMMCLSAPVKKLFCRFLRLKLWRRCMSFTSVVVRTQILSSSWVQVLWCIIFFINSISCVNYEIQQSVT